MALCTQASIREMVLPGAIAVLSPICIGFLIGAEALGGMLAGAISSGFMLAVMMSNAGGAWDNAKKFIENEKVRGGGAPSPSTLASLRLVERIVLLNGALLSWGCCPSREDLNPPAPSRLPPASQRFRFVDPARRPWRDAPWRCGTTQVYGGKKSDTHKACVVGDTVGDPFKDTSGPSLNILIKLMSIFSLVLAPTFDVEWETWWVGLIITIVSVGICGLAYWYAWIYTKDPLHQALKEKEEREAKASAI